MGTFLGAYNVRVIEYPNGETQIRRYSSPLERKMTNDYEDEQKTIPNGYEQNVFDGKLSRVVNSFDDICNHATKEENDRRSFNRTKNKIYEYARSAAWEYFITLTFDKEKVNRYDFDECSRIARKWLNNQRRNAPELQYLLVPELHKDGAWHFHGLLAKTGNIKFKDSGKRTKDKQIVYNMSSWTNGFTTAIPVYNTHGVSKYIGKYITKELCGLTKGKNRYFVSSNLPTPKFSSFLVSNDDDFNDLLDTICNSLGVEIAHISKPRIQGSFVGVDYYELQEINNCDK